MKTGNGLMGIKVVPDDVPAGAIGFRYRTMVTRCDPEGPTGARRILFSPKQLMGPNGTAGMKGPRALEVAVFSFSAKYTDDAACPGWPPHPVIDRAGLSVRVGNVGTSWPRAPVGIRPLDQNTRDLFPRANFGVDDRPEFTGIECFSQSRIQNVAATVIVKRVGPLTVVMPQKNWGHRFSQIPNGWACSAYLPDGEYMKWRVSVMLDGLPTCTFHVVYPAAEASLLNPFEACSFFSEFWTSPAAIAVEVWDCAVFAPPTGWSPIKRFLYHFPGPGSGWENNHGYGPRILPNGHLELSNDQPDEAYAAKASILVLP